MSQFEYKVIPAPAKGQKARGVRRGEDRFAYAMQEKMNELAKERWEFLRSETLPHEERSGLTSTVTTYRSMLVFRRAMAEEAQEPAPPQTETQAFFANPVAEPLPAPDVIDARRSETEEDPSQDGGASFFELDEEAAERRMTKMPSALRHRAQTVRTEQDVAAE